MTKCTIAPLKIQVHWFQTNSQNEPARSKNRITVYKKNVFVLFNGVCFRLHFCLESSRCMSYVYIHFILIYIICLLLFFFILVGLLIIRCRRLLWRLPLFYLAAAILVMLRSRILPRVQNFTTGILGEKEWWFEENSDNRLLELRQRRSFSAMCCIILSTREIRKEKLETEMAITPLLT